MRLAAILGIRSSTLLNTRRAATPRSSKARTHRAAEELLDPQIYTLARGCQQESEAEETQKTSTERKNPSSRQVWWYNSQFPVTCLGGWGRGSLLEPRSLRDFKPCLHTQTPCQKVKINGKCSQASASPPAAFSCLLPPAQTSYGGPCLRLPHRAHTG